MIHDDNLQQIWKEVVDSISRQHIDEESNKKKKLQQVKLTTDLSTTRAVTSTENQQASAVEI